MRCAEHTRGLPQPERCPDVPVWFANTKIVLQHDGKVVAGLRQDKACAAIVGTNVRTHSDALLKPRLRSDALGRKRAPRSRRPCCHSRRKQKCRGWFCGASARPRGLVAARRDTLETASSRTGARREAAVDRIPGDRTSEESFDSHVRLTHAHRTTGRPALWTTPLPGRLAPKRQSRVRVDVDSGRKGSETSLTDGVALV